MRASVWPYAQDLPVGFWQGGERLADRVAEHHALARIGGRACRAQGGQASGQPALPLGRAPLVANRVAGDGVQPWQDHLWGGAPVPEPRGGGERIAYDILSRLPAIQPALGITQDGRGVAVKDLAKPSSKARASTLAPCLLTLLRASTRPGVAGVRQLAELIC